MTDLVSSTPTCLKINNIRILVLIGGYIPEEHQNALIGMKRDLVGVLFHWEVSRETIEWYIKKVSKAVVITYGDIPAWGLGLLKQKQENIKRIDVTKSSLNFTSYVPKGLSEKELWNMAGKVDFPVFIPLQQFLKRETLSDIQYGKNS
jgi:hypothetical protein